jgi:hypothetical protein
MHVYDLEVESKAFDESRCSNETAFRPNLNALRMEIQGASVCGVDNGRTSSVSREDD